MFCKVIHEIYTFVQSYLISCVLVSYVSKNVTFHFNFFSAAYTLIFPPVYFKSPPPRLTTLPPCQFTTTAIRSPLMVEPPSLPRC